MCAACAQSGQQLAVAPVVNSYCPLPAAPAGFGTATKVDPPKVGEDARTYASRERVGRLTNALQLKNDRKFWDAVEASIKQDQENQNGVH
jgi:hypothetical protein